MEFALRDARSMDSAFNFSAYESGGLGREVIFFIHKPEWDTDEGICLIESEQLPSGCVIRGEDPLQALQLAVAFCRLFCCERGYLWMSGKAIYSEESSQADE